MGSTSVLSKCLFKLNLKIKPHRVKNSLFFTKYFSTFNMNENITRGFPCIRTQELIPIFTNCLTKNDVNFSLSRIRFLSVSVLANKEYRKKSSNEWFHQYQNARKPQFSSVKVEETKRKVAEKMGEIKENVLTIPNALCVFRIIATPFLGYLVLQELYVASLGLFILAGCSDLIDGYIARTFPSQKSMLGSFLDPAADKLLIATLFLTLTIKGIIPVPLTSMIILRDVCLMSAGFYIRYMSLPPPKTLNRYFDVSFATARLSPTAISKVNTLVQLSLVAFSLAAPVFDFVDHFYLHVLWYVTGVSTILSAASYLYYKDTYKLLSQSSKTHNRKNG